MGVIKTFAELITPDERTLRFTSLGFSTAGVLSADDAAEYQQRTIAHCDLHEDVPELTRKGFERLRTLHSYGVLCYEAFTVAQDLAWLQLEQALRERFVAFYEGTIPLTRVRSGQALPITASNFEQVEAAFRSGGTHCKGRWELALRRAGTMPFRGSMAELLSWARKEKLLDGQRNGKLDPIYVELRNAVAHPDYHLGGPPDSARTIRDLAEIINRLWGHRTPGGRLYPAPLERQVLVVAWTDAPAGTIGTTLRYYQLEAFVHRSRPPDEGNWTCVVVLGVFDDESLRDFNGQYERTTFPTALLWGPGSPEDALAWVSANQPEADTTDYLDRLFCVRIYEGRVSLPRRPEIALALSPDRREGRWLVVRADVPNDAFGHGRHLKDGVPCGGDSFRGFRGNPAGPQLPNCAIEELLDGSYEDMTNILRNKFNVTAANEVPTVRARELFPMWIAPDVDAD